MRRDSYTFAKFKEVYIDHPDGYFPVYSCIKEDNNGEPLHTMQIDLICEWRLSDGKIRFIEVDFDTEVEFRAIVEYLRAAAGLLNAAIQRRLNELKM